MISNVSQSMTSNESISVKEDKSWEMYATYCLEGILTPVISFAGIIGKILSVKKIKNTYTRQFNLLRIYLMDIPPKQH